jgi:hypothetical protein
MNQLDQSQEAGEAPEAAHGRSDLQKELAEGLRQRAAISAVLRAIVGSPHDLQPIFDAILDNAIRLCRAESGTFRLVEEAGFRLVAHAAVSEGFSPPILREHGNFLLRLLAGKSPVHIPPTGQRENSDAPLGADAHKRRASRSAYYFAEAHRIEHFTEKEIELVTDFGAQAGIALEIIRRERQLREVQMELAHANRVVTLGQLTASITHEPKQPIAAARTSAGAALRWLDKTPPDLAEG